MILPFPPHLDNLIKIVIPLPKLAILFQRASLVFLLIFALSLPISCATTKPFENEKNKLHTKIAAMKVHPMPRKRNITIRYDPNSRNSISESRALMGLSNKKLRRLPHVFSRVLELPFRSDADVSVEESPDCFRFVAETDSIGDEVSTHTIEIHPGVIKIVVRESGSLELSLDELELDVWRFRLPETTLPELASAVFVEGELIVTVPKTNGVEMSLNGGGDTWGDGNGDFTGGMGGRLVLVQ